MLRPTKRLLAVAMIAGAMIVASVSTSLAQSLTLAIDPYSGGVTIQNSSTTTALSLDSYEILSASGQLAPDPSHTSGVGWDSLANAGLGGWDEVGPSTSALSELNLTSSTSIPAGGGLNLGHPFTPDGTPDLQWGYTAPGNVLTRPAPVLYAGGLQVQVVNLLSNHGASVETTAMVLLNQETSHSFNIDGYSINSASGSLHAAGFSGFAAHNVPGWESVAPTANILSELNLSSSTTLAPGQGQVLGPAFTTGATNDLTLLFHLVGGGGVTPNGTVLYKSELAGDANGDGFVNGLDISLISSNWLSTGTLPGDANLDGFVNGLDISLIASHWLNTLAGGGSSAGGGTTAVPEPAAMQLMMMAIAMISSYSIYRRPFRTGVRT